MWPVRRASARSQFPWCSMGRGPTRASRKRRGSVSSRARTPCAIAPMPPPAISRVRRPGRSGFFSASFLPRMRSPTIMHPRFWRGLSDAPPPAAYDVMLHTSPWQDAARSASHYSDQRTDGIVVVAPTTDSDVLEGLAGIGFLPTVAISASPDRCGPLGIASVDVDNSLGIALAVEHLTALGHTHIAHLTGKRQPLQRRCSPRRPGNEPRVARSAGTGSVSDLRSVRCRFGPRRRPRPDGVADSSDGDRRGQRQDRDGRHPHGG